MKENTTPIGANAHTIAAMSKEEITSALAEGYEKSKPMNDALVDLSLRLAALTAEVYRRSIQKQLPGVPITRRRTTMRVEISIHPNHGLPKIAQRLAELAKEGVEILEVQFDENTGAYSFFTAPEFNLETKATP